MFVEDVRLPGMVHLGIVRSTTAHADIEELDVDEARDSPGVVGVWTAEDLPAPPRVVRRAGGDLPVPRTLAQDAVRYAGEPIAVVAAETPYEAEDAVGTVFVELEARPLVRSARDGLTDDVLLYDGAGSNTLVRAGEAEPRRPGGAGIPLSLRLPRVAAAPLQPSGCVADRSGDTLRVWATCADPERLRGELAEMLGIADGAVEVQPTHGPPREPATARVPPELLLAAQVSSRLGRPVKFVETRSENLVSMGHYGGVDADVRAQVDRDGILRDVAIRVIQDLGARPDPALIGALHELPPPGSVPYGGELRWAVDGVVTNTTPVVCPPGGARAIAGRVLELLMDRLATELDIDPATLRRRNLRPELAGPAGRVLDQALADVDYEGVRAVQAGMSGDGEAWLRGAGVALRMTPDAAGLPQPSAHACAVQLDTGTGAVVVRGYNAVHGVGTPGDLRAWRAGAARGVSQALYEDVSYGEDGQPMSATFLTYLAPAPGDVAPTSHRFVGTAVAAPHAFAEIVPEAVLSAVMDALRPCATSALSLPVTPADVSAALRDAQAGARGAAR